MHGDGPDGYERLERDAAAFVRASGIALTYVDLPPDTPAEFDGVSMTMNRRQPLEWRSHYLVHSFGSIVGWCVNLDGVAAMYDELRDAKCVKDHDPGRLERAISAFRAFEERASSYSVQLLTDFGHTWAIGAFTLFFRADLAAMTQYHREGWAPSWPEYLAEWQRSVHAGERALEPFVPVAIPPFVPSHFEKQQVKQQRG